MECTLLQWLMSPCPPEDVKGDQYLGYFLGIDKVNEKINILRSKFECRVNFRNFHHFLFIKPTKEVFASGSIEVEIISKDGTFHVELVGAATFDIEEYDNDKESNPHYAATLKSLCKSNALLEYPQFGSLLNKQELNRTIQGKRLKPSEKVKESVKAAING